MQKAVIAGLAMALAAGFAPAPAVAGDLIHKACIKGGRTTSEALCGCIQQVADQKLSTKDQRRAAGFFRDPHEAQKIRQSDNTNHESFWQRYKDFGLTAGEVCADLS